MCTILWTSRVVAQLPTVQRAEGKTRRIDAGSLSNSDSEIQVREHLPSPTTSTLRPLTASTFRVLVHHYHVKQ